MGATGTFLMEIFFGILKNHVIRTCTAAISAVFAFFRVDYHKPVITLIYSIVFASGHAGRFIAMIAQARYVMYPHFRVRAFDVLMQFQPELPDFRLGGGIGPPIVIAMLIFTGKLAVITAVAL
jgi:hypothetical protein